MKASTSCLLTIVACAGLAIAPAAAQTPMATTFTYQGYLREAGVPLDGSADFECNLWGDETGGEPITYPVYVLNVDVADGLFTLRLDFGATVFQSQRLWLEIAVRSPAGSGDYTTLSPRQELTPTPYAIVSGNVAGTPGYIAKFNTGNSVGDSVIYQNGTNIGVGTQCPGGYAKLHVHRTDGALIKITNGATGTGYNDGVLLSFITDSSAAACLWNRETAPLIFATNNAERVRIEADGNVGIGTNAPTAPLHVMGDVNVAVLAQNYDGAYGGRLFGGFRGVEGGVDDYNTTNDGAAGGYLWVIGRGGKSYGSLSSATGWGTLYGAYGSADGANTNYGVYGYAANGTTNYAGYFNGNVHVTGTLSKGAGSFKIDHPLDPEHKYLYHSFVESPDMMNVYNGNVVLDDGGTAVVTLPDWFEALNRDFRYQLTAIGGPGPNLYVAREISGNQFQIAGGSPGLKVSWQVTGIRHDALADAQRIPVEDNKPADEGGTYLHPKAWGMPEEMGIDYAHRPSTDQPDSIEQ